MARMGRWRTSAHPVAGHEQRPVETPAVVRDQPRVRPDHVRQRIEEGRLLGVVGQEQLDLLEPIPVPRPDPDQERDGAGPGRQTGRLGVEADERARPAGAPSGRPPSRSRSTGRATDGRSTRTYPPAAPRIHSPSTASASRRASPSVRRASSARTEAATPDAAPVRGRRGRRSRRAAASRAGGGRPVGDRAGRRRSCRARGRRSDRDGRSRAEPREQAQRECLRVDVGFETRAGAGWAARLAGTAVDQLRPPRRSARRSDRTAAR